MGNDKAKSDARADRLAAALRTNLRRRKVQGRARNAEELAETTFRKPETEESE